MDTFRILITLVILSLVAGCGGQGATITPEPTDTPQPTDTPKSTVALKPAIMPPPAQTAGETWTRPTDEMVMVYVPGGTFQMGSAEDDPDAYDYEKPRHTVCLDAFWIDQTEVTNAQYRRCVEAEVCQEPGCWGNSDFNAPDQPVVCVSWNDAQTYCEWAGARLLTEAEWGYAARGPNGSIYPWGDIFDGARLNFCDANCIYGWKDARYDDGYETMAAVGSFDAGASWCGALDMSGNVWEWVSDWYGDYPSTKQTNPTGPEKGSFRVLRGGAWDDVRGRVRAASRLGGDPIRRSSRRGLRCSVASAFSQ